MAPIRSKTRNRSTHGDVAEIVAVLEAELDELKGLERVIAELALGRRKLPQSPGRRHHFVPQFLLARFRGSRSAGRELFVLDKHDGSVEARKVKDAACSTGLYDLDTELSHGGVVEALLGLLETYAAPSLRTLLATPERFTAADRTNVAFFIAAQQVRSPADLRAHEAFGARAATMQAAVEMANIRGSQRRRREASQAYEQLISGELMVEPTRAGLFGVMLPSLVQVAMMLREMGWIRLDTTTDHPFVIGDRPLTFHDPSPKFSWSGAGWQSSPFSYGLLPVSRQSCLRIGPAVGKPLVIRKGVRQVRRTNLATYAWAERYVYGPSPDVLAELHQHVLDDPGCLPVVRPAQVAVLEDIETADPAIAEEHRQAGREPYVTYFDEETDSYRTVSYELIDSLAAARRAVSPSPRRSDEVVDERA